MGERKHATKRSRHVGCCSTLLAAAALLLVAWSPSAAQTGAGGLAHWEPAFALPGVVDLSTERRDGSLTVSAAGQLFLLEPGGTLTPFARGAGGYAPDPGFEAYLTLARSRRVRGARCAFRRDDVYAIEVGTPGVILIEAGGQARRVADLPAGIFPNGITFDNVGRFNHRVLVTALIGVTTTVYAVDCRGRVEIVAEHVPRVEGGIAVAPRSFGRYGGRLIAPDEFGGGLIAIDADGHASTLVMSGLPGGADIGVESTGFVPPHVGWRVAAFLADRGTPGGPHPGTDSILSISGAALVGAGVRKGDLLVATEAGADTIAVRCRRACTVRRVADGPAVAHAEGHIVFMRAR